MFGEREKGIFLTQNSLKTLNPFRVKSSQNAEISHSSHILPRRFQGAF